MTASDMATIIADNLLANISLPSQLPSGSTGYDTIRSQMINSWTNICKSLIQYIQDNAKVQVTVATHLHTGVTTGPGTSGPPVAGSAVIEYGDPKATPHTGGIS